ncbi:MAG: hypothetical protein ACR5KX_05710 [Wolbachia sp.]
MSATWMTPSGQNHNVRTVVCRGTRMTSGCYNNERRNASQNTRVRLKSRAKLSLEIKL